MTGAPPAAAVPDALVAALGRLGVACLHEAMGRRGLLDPALAPRLPGKVAAGRARTAAPATGDNWALHRALDRLQPGEMLLVAPDTAAAYGYFGDIMALAATLRQAAGLVIDGGVRDLAALRRMGFPVWSRHVCARGTVKLAPGRIDVPVICGGALVHPGDVIVADDDGVVAVPADQAEAIRSAARARQRAEAQLRRRLRAGARLTELLGLAPAEATSAAPDGPIGN